MGAGARTLVKVHFRHIMSAPLLENPASYTDATALTTKEDLDKILPQVNRFRMAEGILLSDVEKGITVGYRDIRADDWWAEDHIPGRPLFPGVLQCELAAQICTYDILSNRFDRDKDGDLFVGLGGLEAVRFRAPVVPGCRLVMAVFLERAGRKLCRYVCQGYVGEKMVFEGKILGVRF